MQLPLERETENSAYIDTCWFCCSIQDYDEEDDALHRKSAADQIHHMSNEELLAESGKLQMLMDLLKRLSMDGHRTLVFSQSRKMLDIIEKLLKTDVGRELLKCDFIKRNDLDVGNIVFFQL